MTDLEDKLARFERLAQRRVTEALKSLRLIGNLANRHNYLYSEEHVRQIFDALDAELRRLKKRFKDQNTGSEQLFKFRKRHEKK